MILRIGFLMLCAVAASMPLVVRRSATFDSNVSPERNAGPGFAGSPWPAQFEGRTLDRVPLSDADERFNAGFPGQIARFTDGRRELILRWITRPSRMVHPAADCFRGLGYSVKPAPARLDNHGLRWSCFTAARGATRLRVRERITGLTDDSSWTDVSAWFWSALFERSRGPWMATTVVEPETTD